MFKLPVLAPHLTGTHGIEAHRTQSGANTPLTNGYGSILQPGSFGSLAKDTPEYYGGSAEVKDWEAQGRDITSDVTSSERYKSLALHAEVKLAEALERCTRLCPDVYTSDGDEKPNKLKTAVCSQLLGEFAELCGPFSNALKSIRDELVVSIYSPLYASDKGLLVFDQIPWFKVAERLESEKAMMLEERKKFQELLDQQQAMIGRIEDQVDVYRHGTAAANQEAMNLKARVEALGRSEEGARLEAKTGREELKRMRKEFLKMKDDLEAQREAHKKSVMNYEANINTLQQHVVTLTDLVKQAEKASNEAQQSLAGWVPPDEVAEIMEQVKAMQEQVASAEAKALRAEEQLKEYQHQMGSMTPRPSWKALNTYGIIDTKGEKTQALVLAAAQKLANQSETLQTALQEKRLTQAVSLPEPMPREIKLAITTDSSAYFMTEEPTAAPTSIQVACMGVGPNVPRCLRWHPELLEVPVMKHEEAEALAMQILDAKRVYDAHHFPEHLQSFVYIHLAAVSRQSAAQPAVLRNSMSSNQRRPSSGTGGGGTTAAAASRRSSHTGQSLMQQPKGAAGGWMGALRASKKIRESQSNVPTREPSKSSVPTREQSTDDADQEGPMVFADHKEVVKRAYALYHAVRIYANMSPLLRLFGRVLAGALPEEAFSQQRLFFSAIAHAARKLAYARANALIASRPGSSAGATKPELNKTASKRLSKTRSSKGGQAGAAEPDEGEALRVSLPRPPTMRPKPDLLLVSTEDMIGALGALLPGRPPEELAVLEEAYTGFVASCSQQQRDEEQQGEDSDDEKPQEPLRTDRCLLARVEDLLRPLVLGCSTQKIAASVSSHGAEGSEAIDEYDIEQSNKRLHATLSCSFVTTLMTELVDELEDVAGEATQAATAMTMTGLRPESASSVSHPPGLDNVAENSEQGSSAPSSPTPNSPSTSAMGQKVPAAALVSALVSKGLLPNDAVGVVGPTLGCSVKGGGASLTEGLVNAWQQGMLDGVPVFSNLTMANGKALTLLQRPGTHDVRGMLDWVNGTCEQVAANVEDALSVGSRGQSAGKV